MSEATRPPLYRWIGVVAINLALGIVGVVPIFLLYYLARNSVLPMWGFNTANPTENDGVLPIVMVVLPPCIVFAGVWWLVNVHLLRRLGTYAWLLAVCLTALPFVALS